MAISSADFRATVQHALEQPGAGRLPREGEVLLLGTTAGGSWIKFRVPKRYRWFSHLFVRVLVREKAIARLAIVVPDDAGNPRRMRVVFVERDGDREWRGISDPRLARLAAAALGEWSPAANKPMFKLFDRPWPTPLLVGALLLELLTAAIEAPRDRLPADALDFAVMVLTAATVVLLWRQTRAGYALAVALSAVQLVWRIVFYVPYIQSSAPGSGFWLLWSLSYPALIWVMLWILYIERRRTSVVSSENPG